MCLAAADEPLFALGVRQPRPRSQTAECPYLTLRRSPFTRSFRRAGQCVTPYVFDR